jgi:hypothetical protein
LGAVGGLLISIGNQLRFDLAVGLTGLGLEEPVEVFGILVREVELESLFLIAAHPDEERAQPR